MVNGKIPYAYILLARKLREKSYGGRISRYDAKFSASYLRIQRRDIQKILAELKEYGLIRCVDKSTIEVLEVEED